MGETEDGEEVDEDEDEDEDVEGRGSLFLARLLFEVPF
jgi:hypothetical protein